MSSVPPRFLLQFLPHSFKLPTMADCDPQEEAKLTLPPPQGVLTRMFYHSSRKEIRIVCMYVNACIYVCMHMCLCVCVCILCRHIVYKCTCKYVGRYKYRIHVSL